MKRLVELVPVGEWLAADDMFERSKWSPYKKAAVIHGIACLGSAVLADTGFELKQGEEIAGEGYNSKIGNAATAAPEDEQKIFQKLGAIRKGKDWSLYPKVNATTNGVYLIVWLTE